MTTRFSRRSFAAFLGKAAAATAAAPLISSPERAAALPTVSSGSGSGFPKDFLWGTATASYQVEGSARKEGRGPSIWDTFSHTNGKVDHGDTGDVADDFMNRYRNDVRLMAGLGVQAFRFSVSWSRIFPLGDSKPNQAGLDFYLHLVEALQANGIRPFCTLYHWDLPQPLQDRGGWENADIAKSFAEYAGFTAGRLSRAGVSDFLTMNEIRTFVELGYGNGTHAPGLQVGPRRLAQLTHNCLVGHGLAVAAIRAQAVSGTRVGLAENPTAVVPVTQSPADLIAARLAMREENAAYLTAICEGRYTDGYLARLGADAPKFTAEQMKTIAAPLDMLGLNIYTPTYARAATTAAGYQIVPCTG